MTLTSMNSEQRTIITLIMQTSTPCLIYVNIIILSYSRHLPTARERAFWWGQKSIALWLRSRCAVFWDTNELLRLINCRYSGGHVWAGAYQSFQQEARRQGSPPSHYVRWAEQLFPQAHWRWHNQRPQGSDVERTQGPTAWGEFQFDKFSLVHLSSVITNCNIPIIALNTLTPPTDILLVSLETSEWPYSRALPNQWKLNWLKIKTTKLKHTLAP